MPHGKMTPRHKAHWPLFTKIFTLKMYNLLYITKHNDVTHYFLKVVFSNSVLLLRNFKIGNRNNTITDPTIETAN